MVRGGGQGSDLFDIVVELRVVLEDFGALRVVEGLDEMVAAA